MAIHVVDAATRTPLDTAPSLFRCMSLAAHSTYVGLAWQNIWLLIRRLLAYETSVEIPALAVPGWIETLAKPPQETALHTAPGRIDRL